MSKKKKKQAKPRAIADRIPQHDYMLQELLRRDARSGDLASLILQLYGYHPTEEGKNREDIETAIQRLREGLSQDYGIRVGDAATIALKINDIQNSIASDFERGVVFWNRHKQAFAVLSRDLKESIQETLARRGNPDTLEPQMLWWLAQPLVSNFFGFATYETEDGEEEYDDDSDIRWMEEAIIAVHQELRGQKSMTPSDEEKEVLMLQALRQGVKRAIINTSGDEIIRTVRNWVAPREGSVIECGEGSFFNFPGGLVVPPLPGSPPPEGGRPMLTITIDLSNVHLVGVTKLAKTFTADVNKALAELPAEWRVYPKDLEFLRTTSLQDFLRDLQRYDLHMQYGLSFRQIAWLEAQKRTGQPLPSSPQPRTIGTAIEGEDGVEKSVKRMHTAIFRSPYRARRRHIDTPAEGLDTYFCPTHPDGDCPKECPTLQDFQALTNAILPSDTTGSIPSAVSIDRVPEVKLAIQHSRIDDESDDDGGGSSRMIREN